MNSKEDPITKEELSESVNEFLRNGGAIKKFKDGRKTLTRLERFWACEKKQFELFQKDHKRS